MAASPSIFDYSNEDSQQIIVTSFNGATVVDFDMTEEQYQEYFEALAKSEGFDVPHYPNTVVPGRTEPILNLDSHKEELDHYGGLAIKQYNEQNGTNFEIVEFVKVNAGVATGLLYFMTFKAKSPTDHSITTFQARVFAGIKETEVNFCREVLSGS